MEAELIFIRGENDKWIFLDIKRFRTFKKMMEETKGSLRTKIY